MNKGFTQEELAFKQNQQLQLPADTFLPTLKEPNYVKQILHKSVEMNKGLGRKKAHSSTTKTLPGNWHFRRGHKNIESREGYLYTEEEKCI